MQKFVCFDSGFDHKSMVFFDQMGIFKLKLLLPPLILYLTIYDKTGICVYQLYFNVETPHIRGLYLWVPLQTIQTHTHTQKSRGGEAEIQKFE